MYITTSGNTVKANVAGIQFAFERRRISPGFSRRE
jgi:hypothetical protein